MKRGLTRWLGLVATLSLFNGCPRECEQPDAEIPLVSAEKDPTLGIFEGQIDWLQSGDQSTLRVTVSRQAEAVTRQCDSARVELTYELETGEPAISAAPKSSVQVDNGGVIIPQTQHLTIDAIALADAGKLPDAPGIAMRKPVGTLILEATSDYELSATIEVRSNTDQLTVALGKLARAQ